MPQTPGRRTLVRAGSVLLCSATTLACGVLSAPGAAGSPTSGQRVRPGQTVPVSLTAAGKLSRSGDEPSISDNGKHVAFRTVNKHMVDGQSIESWSTYLRDRPQSENQLLDQRYDGLPPDPKQVAGSPTISGNGRFVAFLSRSIYLVDAEDHNRTDDVFLRDTLTGTTTLVSRTPDGNAGNGQGYVDEGAVSRNGRWVVFSSRATDHVADDTNGCVDVFLYDARDGSVEMISRAPHGGPAYGNSGLAAISDDGRFITYTSDAPNLVQGDRNDLDDIMLYDVRNKTTSIVTRSPTGQASNGDSYKSVLSGDGGVVVFVSVATNLVDAADTVDTRDVFAYDVTTGITALVSRDLNGHAAGGVDRYPRVGVSADGTTAAYDSEASDILAGDTNGRPDAFAFTLATDTTTLVGRNSDGSFPAGGGSSPSVSRNGRLIAFVGYSLEPGPDDTHHDAYVYRLPD